MDSPRSSNRNVAPLGAVRAIVVAALLVVGCSTSPPPPNFVIVLTDDARAVDLDQLPATVAGIGEKGITFSRSFVTTSLCCPSRVSLLTGNYAHTHGLLTIGPPRGGALRLRELGAESDTIATRLAARGYRTGYLGKYVYGVEQLPIEDVPPGWERWVVFDRAGYQNYTLRDNGRLTRHGRDPREYSTDLLSRKARRFVEEAAADPRPFLLVVAPFAPHRPALPPARYRGLAVGPSGQLASHPDDGQVRGDPPPWPIPASPARMERNYRPVMANHRRSLWAVDDLVSRLLADLESQGLLEQTWVIFTSDNGLLFGERTVFQRKHAAYEPSIKVPLLVRGPGAPAGLVRDEIVANIDLAPTLAELAGIPDADNFDGRSLARLWRGEAERRWRQDLLIEFFGPATQWVPPAYQALRGEDFLHVRYEGGACEHYDLTADPEQLVDICASLPAERLAALDRRLATLGECRGPACRE